MGILRADLLTHSQLAPAGGSVVLDGSGDYLTIPNHSAFHFTGDYTIDFYIKFTTNSGTQRIFGQRNADASDISVLGEFASNNFYYYYSQNGSSTVSLTIGTYGTNIELNTWHHVAIVCDGGVHHSYLDGVQTSVNANNPPPLNDGDSTWSIGRQGAYTANEFNGSIYGFRITNKALYKTNFTLSKFKPKVLPETILLCCVSSTSVTEAEVSVAGDITSNGDPQVGDTPLLKEDITDTGVVFDGFGNFATSTYMVPPTGKTTERNRGRALYAGGYKTPNTITAIDSIEIQSGGLTEQFGDLSSTAHANCSACSSSTRMVTNGGWTGSANNNTMEFVTIANSSNSTDFGDLAVGRRNNISASNQTRGLVYGGNGSPANTAQVDFFTIATTGNAADFGDASSSTAIMPGAGSSTTRALFAGGYTPSASDTIDYFTIASAGNATDFGNLSSARKNVGGLSSSTRTLFGGGGYPSAVNTIDFVTTATTGDATDFGDLTLARGIAHGTSNQTRGIFMGGSTNPARQNTIDYVTIATTGNASDFGDFRTEKQNGGVASDSHGGL